MDAGLVVAVAFAVVFAITNGLHDASNAIATLVTTRAARSSQAIFLASAFNIGAVRGRSRRRRHHWWDRYRGTIGRDRGDRGRARDGRGVEPDYLTERVVYAVMKQS
jgi:hypothetical protein